MILNLLDWWRDLQGFELILWGIALFFSLLFLTQAVLSFIGGSDSLDSSIDADGNEASEGSQFFTIKNMIAFFTMFGWTGLAAYKAGLSKGVTITIALVAGTALVYIMYILMRRISGLKHSGTLQVKNAINKIGETYLRIPAKRGGIGKIQVQVQGRLMELDAMTDDGDDISTGKPVQVISTLNNQILLVTSKLIA